MPPSFPWRSSHDNNNDPANESNSTSNSNSNAKNDQTNEEQERSFGTFSSTFIRRGVSSSSGQGSSSAGGSSGSTQPVPSNASMISEQSSRPSSLQSSLFSRTASTMNTMSTAESRVSKLANILEQAGEDTTAAQSMSGASMRSTQSTGRKMRVVDFEDLSELDEYVSDLPGTSVSSGNRAGSMSSQNRTFMQALDPWIYNTSKSSPEMHASPKQPSVSLQSRQQQSVTVKGELTKLADDLSAVLNQVSNNGMDSTKAATSINQLLRTCSQAQILSAIEVGQVTLHSEPAVGRIIKIVLHFVDNILTDSAQASRMTILQSFYELGVKLQLVPSTLHTVPYPSNFAVGSIAKLPAQDLMESLISEIASNTMQLSEQEGAFIAPVLRGISPEFAVLTLSFGFPDPTNEHYSMVSQMNDIAPDIHIYCQKNYIRACSGRPAGSRLKPPFRVATNPTAPPIGMSLSSSTAAYQSGTLGGYIYPKVGKDHPLYEDYGKSTFAMTCGHVVLMDSGSAYPEVVVPSSVLISYYKKTLTKEREKYSPRSEERATYQREISQLDMTYPVVGVNQTNRPKQALGQIAWGERKVVNGSMSDLAIVKCDSSLTCRNFLGDDVEFSEYDPALMFGNLTVKRIVRKIHPGMKVFKYGSTSKFTSGEINGPRIVYWADGRLQTSEFVIASGDSSLFASGGDSGAWVLQKSEDNQEENRSPSLGVVGMLHSYDGERREFGLISTIDKILERLAQVTNVEWGVVGVPDLEVDSGDSMSPASELSSSDVE